MNNFCHLHVHNEYSVLDGFGTAEQYVKKAKGLGMTSLALTNHGNIDGAIKFQKCCELHNIKPIFGCELYVVNDIAKKEKGEKRGHIVALVENQKGWNNLVKMLTVANVEGFYKRPRVDYKLLLDNYEGLIFTTACLGSFLYNEGGIDFLEKMILKTKNIFCEILPLDFSDQKRHNEFIINIASKYSLEVIATNDCHYPNKEDCIAQEVLLAIQSKAKWKDKDRWHFEANDLYLKSFDEINSCFENKHSYINKQIYQTALENTNLIANRCNFQLVKQKVFLPVLDKGIDEVFLFKKICFDGLKSKIINNGIESFRYRKRLRYEINTIGSLGFLRYFLIIYDIVRWCKENNILVGPSRGSVGGSLVAFLMGITEIDPIKHNLMFERFISFERVDLPDIDIDFEDKKRLEVRKYIEDKYGFYNVASVSTFLQMKSRMVFRDVCRVFDVPLAKVNFISNFIDENDELDEISNISIFDKIFNTIDECIRFKNKFPNVIDICLKLEGQVRGLGKHAAAIIITENDLRISEKCNLTIKNDVLAINWDKRDAEYMGMLKIDILGLSNLSILHYIKDLIKINYAQEINLYDIDLNDEKVLREFSRGNCLGIFQFGTYGLSNLCKDLRIDSFNLLVNATAVYRPASLRSGMTDEFKKRRSNVSYSYNYNNKLDNILGSTYGIIVYQEQIMRIINEVAGMSFIKADKIRKLLDLKDRDELDKYKYEFIQGCIKNSNFERLDAISAWKVLMKHEGYGFNLSHACGYTVLSFINMFFKVYYPLEFFCSVLTYINSEKRQKIIEEAIRFDFKVATPKIGISDSNKWICKDKILYMPFIEVKGIGEVYAKKVFEYKNKGFFEDKIKGKLASIMNEIGAWDNKKLFYNCNIIPYSV